MATCRLIPLAEDGKHDSKLYTELHKVIPNRDNLMDILYKTKYNKEFIEKFPLLEKDEYGDFTISSLVKSTNLLDMINDEDLTNAIKKELSFKDNISNTWSNATDLSNKIKEFVEKSELANIAVVNIVDNNGNLDINVTKNVNADEENNIYVRRLMKNKHLRKVLESWGVQVQSLSGIKGLQYNGYVDFNPTDVTNDIKSIIYLAQGTTGEMALSEEFSHVLIRMFRNNPIVSRLVEALKKSPESVSAILGDNLNEYIELYNDNDELLAQEAAGQLLADALESFDSVDFNESNPLIGRAVNALLEFFESKDADDLDKAELRALQECLSLVKQIAVDVVKESGVLKSEPVDLSEYTALNNMYKLGVYNTGAFDAKAKLIERLAETDKDVKKWLYIFTNKLKFNTRDLDKDEEGIEDNTNELSSKLNTVLDEVKNDKLSIDSLLLLNKAIKNVASESAILLNAEKKLNKQMEEGIVVTDAELTKELLNIKNLSSYYNKMALNVIDLLNSFKKNVFVTDGNESENKIKNDLIEELDKASHLLSKSSNEVERLFANNATPVFLRFIQECCPHEIEFHYGPLRGKKLTLVEMWENCEGDIGMFERWLGAMGESTDFFLGALDKRVRISKEEARLQTLEDVKTIEAAALKAKQVGFNPDQFYELDENGVMTGDFIIEYDYAKYYEDRKEYINKRKENNKKHIETLRKTKGEAAVREFINSLYKDFSKLHGTVSMPKAEYKNKKWEELMRQNGAKEFYDAVFPIYFKRIKQVKGHRKNRAIKIRKSMYQRLISEKDENSNILVESWKTLKDKLKLHESDTELQGTILDFNGRALNVIPSYYQFEDNSNNKEMSTDFVNNMITYCNMANNYNVLNDIIGRIEMAKYAIGHRTIPIKKGNINVFQKFKVGEEEIENIATKNVNDSNMYRMLEDYLKTHIYNQPYELLGNTKNGFSWDKLSHLTQNLTSLSTMGFNFLANFVNVFGVINQSSIDVLSKSTEFYSLSDINEAHKRFFQYLSEGGILNDNKNNFLQLFHEKFNVMDNFKEMISKEDFNNNKLLKKIFGDKIAFLGDKCGNFYVFSIMALALANAIKTKVGNKEVSLLDLYEKVDVIEGKPELGSQLKIKKEYLKEGVMFNGKKVVTDEELKKRRDAESKEHKAKRFKKEKSGDIYSDIYDDYISAMLGEEEDSYKGESILSYVKENEVAEQTLINTLTFKSQGLAHKYAGIYNTSDRIAAKRYFLGQAITKMRDWIFPQVQRRVAKVHYNHLLGIDEEGFYRTTVRYLGSCLNELNEGGFKMSVFSDEFNKLSEEEKQNIMRSLKDIGLMIILSVISAMLYSMWSNYDDDKDGMGYFLLTKLTALLIKCRIEHSALTPIGVFKEVDTVLNSPTVLYNTIDRLKSTLNLLVPHDGYAKDLQTSIIGIVANPILKNTTEATTRTIEWYNN